MKLLYGCTILSACLTMSFGAQITLDQNAIVNPSAEAGGLGSASGNDVLPVPGWTTTDNFTVVQYGASSAPLVAPGAGFGNNFFSGGPGSTSLPGTGGATYTDQATQFIDVSNLSGLIDLSKVAYSLSGFFGGFLNQNDNASLFATFLNVSNTTIGTSAVVGGFNSTKRQGLTELLFGSGGGTIPVGTRSVEITLVMTKIEGFYDDGYADNLAFVATATPEPSMWALAGLGLCGLLAARKMVRPQA
jgi:hypothetical protein